MFSLSNFLLDSLDNEEFILMADADLASSNPGLLKTLISEDKDIIAPLILLDNAGDWYYDQWGFRKNGVSFASRFPYYAGMKSDGHLEEIDSVGSFYLMKGKIAKSFRYHWRETAKLEYGHVGFCKAARKKGFKVFCDTSQIVYHSVLEKYHQQTDWQGPPDTGAIK